jgi:flagellar basal-body rod protein FlgC
MDVMAIAASGMAAAAARLNVSAANTANAGSAGPLDPASQAAAIAPVSPYQPQQLLQYARKDGGVGTEVRKDTRKAQPAYNPASSFADAQGMVAMPAVDLGLELVNQVMAINAFKANVRVFEAGQQASKSLLDIKA